MRMRIHFQLPIQTKKLETDAAVVEDGLSVSRDDVPDAQADVKKWTDSLIKK